MPEKLFFGNYTIKTGSSPSANIHVTYKYTSSYTGKITSFKSYGTANGYIKPNIYLYDATFENSSLLWADDTGSHYVTQNTWNTKAVDNIPVYSGVEYLLGCNLDTQGAITGGSIGARRLKNYTYSTYSALDPIGTGYFPEVNFDGNLAAFGWEPPTISSISETSIAFGLSYTLSGTDFMTSSDPITVEICNNADYDLATTRIAQSVTSQTDNEIVFTADTGVLSSGTAWIFVTTNIEQRNTVPLAVDISSIQLFENNKLPQRWYESDYISMLYTLLPKGFIWLYQRAIYQRLIQDLVSGGDPTQDTTDGIGYIDTVQSTGGSGNVLRRLLSCFALELQRISASATTLLSQSDPGVATYSLGDWERVLGLPEYCYADATLTLDERKRTAHAKLFETSKTPTAGYYANLALILGYIVNITEVPESATPRRMGIARMGVERMGGSSGNSVLQIEITAGNGDLTLLQCLVEQTKPAHVYISWIDSR